MWFKQDALADYPNRKFWQHFLSGCWNLVKHKCLPIACFVKQFFSSCCEIQFLHVSILFSSFIVTVSSDLIFICLIFIQCFKGVQECGAVIHWCHLQDRSAEGDQEGHGVPHTIQGTPRSINKQKIPVMFMAAFHVLMYPYVTHLFASSLVHRLSWCLYPVTPRTAWVQPCSPITWWRAAALSSQSLQPTTLKGQCLLSPVVGSLLLLHLVTFIWLSVSKTISYEPILVKTVVY